MERRIPMNDKELERIPVLEMKDGSISTEHRGKQLTAVPYHKIQAKTEKLSRKELLALLVERAAAKREQAESKPKVQARP